MSSRVSTTTLPYSSFLLLSSCYLSLRPFSPLIYILHHPPFLLSLSFVSIPSNENPRNDSFNLMQKKTLSLPCSSSPRRGEEGKKRGRGGGRRRKCETTSLSSQEPHFHYIGYASPPLFHSSSSFRLHFPFSSLFSFRLIVCLFVCFFFYFFYFFYFFFFFFFFFYSLYLSVVGYFYREDMTAPTRCPRLDISTKKKREKRR